MFILWPLAPPRRLYQVKPVEDLSNTKPVPLKISWESGKEEFVPIPEVSPAGGNGHWVTLCKISHTTQAGLLLILLSILPLFSP